MDTSAVKILIVEDSPVDMRRIKLFLEEEFGSACILYDAESLKQARELTLRYSPDLILLDIILPNGAGEQTILAMQRSCHCPIIIVSSLEDKKVRHFAVGIGCEWVSKSAIESKLPIIIDKALSEFRLRNDRFLAVTERVDSLATMVVDKLAEQTARDASTREKADRLESELSAFIATQTKMNLRIFGDSVEDKPGLIDDVRANKRLRTTLVAATINSSRRFFVNRSIGESCRSKT